MGTQELRAAVLQEATAEATGLVEAAAAQASQLVDSQRRQLEEYANTQVAEHRTIRDRDVATKVAALRIELRNAVLKRKQELLDDLYRELEQKLLTDDTLYHAYLEHLVQQIGQDAPLSIECRQRDASTVVALLPKSGDWPGVRIDTTLADNRGGLFAHYAESELDLTLSAASMGLRERTLVAVAQILFGDKR
ncbi:MAG: V-type ATP synthase subunit E [Candidatus Cryosericum sp.]